MTPEKSKTETARQSHELSLKGMLPSEWLARAVIAGSCLVADYATNKQVYPERLVAAFGQKAALPPAKQPPAVKQYPAKIIVQKRASPHRDTLASTVTFQLLPSPSSDWASLAPALPLPSILLVAVQ